jgi:hypothetical protein
MKARCRPMIRVDGASRVAFERRARGVVLALAAPALVVLLAQVALAQQKPAPAAARTHATTRPPPKKASAAGESGASATSPGAPPPAAPAGQPAANDAGVVEARTLDGGTHVFKFSELDIEGRLKSPQLVYFLRRVRAEFAAGDLGHRTFLLEMSETRKESSF